MPALRRRPDRITRVKADPAKRICLWRCGDCKRQFTVKVGTVFEHMRLPLHKAMQAVYLITSSKKGMEKRRAFHHKMKVLALVGRDSGKAGTMVIDDVKAENSCRW